MAKIYLSSTYEDLIEHRSAACSALRKMRHDIISMEDYGATGARPLDKCLADVAASDVYVGIFAWRYGFVPEGQTRSITQLEYDQAGRTGQPRLVFLAAEDAPWLPSRMDADLGEIRALRARLQLDHVVAFFHSEDDLAGDIGIAVANLLDKPDAATSRTAGGDAEFLRRSLTRMTRDFEAGSRFYLGIGCVIFAIGIILLLLGAFTGNLVLQLGALLVLAFALLPMATMISTRRKKDVLSGYAAALESTTPPPDTVQLVHLFLTRQLAA